MKNHDRTINIESNTQLQELIEEVTSAPEEILRLIVPVGAKILRNEIGLKLLKEKSNQFNKKLAFFTDDEMGKILLARVGFIVKPFSKIKTGDDYFEKLAKGPRVSISDIYVGKKPVYQKKESKDPVIDDFEDKKINKEKEESIWQEIEKENEFEPIAVSDKLSLRRSLWPYLIGFVLSSVIVVLLASYFLLPSARIVINPKREFKPIDLSVKIASSVKGLDGSLEEIPGQFLKLDREFQMNFTASGKELVEEHSTGQIRVYNVYSSSPQTLVANTRFLSSDGKLFRTTEQIRVPGAEIEGGKIIPNSILVEVRADEAGENYNIGPTTFSIPGFQGTPKFNGFYGKSEQSISGGFQGEVTVITEQDLDSVRQILQERVFNLLEQEWPARIPKDLTVLDKSKFKKVEVITIPVEVGSRVKDFVASISGSLSIMAFKESDLKSLVEAKLGLIISDNTFIEQIEPFEYGDFDFNINSQILNIDVKTQAIVTWAIDVEQLVKDILAQDEAHIRQVLATEEGVEKAKITLWPFWSERVPDNPDKIKIEID